MTIKSRIEQSLPEILKAWGLEKHSNLSQAAVTAIITHEKIPIDWTSVNLADVLKDFSRLRKVVVRTQERATALDSHEIEMLGEYMDKAISALVNQCIRSVCHDLGSPMTAAKLSAQMALLNTQNPAMVSKSLDRVIKALNRMEEILVGLEAPRHPAHTLHNQTPSEIPL